MIRTPYTVEDGELIVSTALLENLAGVTGQTIEYQIQRQDDDKFWNFTGGSINTWTAGPPTSDQKATLTEVDNVVFKGLHSDPFDADSGLPTTIEFLVHIFITAGIYKFDEYLFFYPLSESALTAAGIATAVWAEDIEAFADFVVGATTKKAGTYLKLARQGVSNNDITKDIGGGVIKRTIRNDADGVDMVTWDVKDIGGIDPVIPTGPPTRRTGAV